MCFWQNVADPSRNNFVRFLRALSSFECRRMDEGYHYLCNFVITSASGFEEGGEGPRNCRAKIDAEYSCADEVEREPHVVISPVTPSRYHFFFLATRAAYKKHPTYKVTYHPWYDDAKAMSRSHARGSRDFPWIRAIGLIERFLEFFKNILLYIIRAI